jgi:hypothetical protein
MRYRGQITKLQLRRVFRMPKGKKTPNFRVGISRIGKAKVGTHGENNNR